MLSYCLKYRKNVESTNPKVVKKSGRIMLLSKFAMGDSNKWKLTKKSKLLRSLGIRTLLSKIL